MESDPPAIVWFRNDLRLSDNPALHHAVKTGSILPIFIWDPDHDPQMGSASKVWLHHSLTRLKKSLSDKGSKLIIRSGNPSEILEDLISETSATAVYWNRRYEPSNVKQDDEVEKKLKSSNIEVNTFKSYLLAEPPETQNQKGLAFLVFTPFWKHCLQKIEPGTPLKEPSKLIPCHLSLESEDISSLQLLPDIRWPEGIKTSWIFGEKAAQQNLRGFVKQAAHQYSLHRDFPAKAGTSRLSPFLHFGEISPRQIWSAFENSDLKEWKTSQYIAEIGWREFSFHLLHAYPQTVSTPLRNQFKSFPWSENKNHLRAWQKGETGYPIVDAGMRQLWETGWMHNRVRMIVASFLVKHLLINWTVGAKWFWDTLVDADLASNTQGWQWTAGCGADAAPYFRIFNPTTQAKKFDPQGEYIHRWVPELRGLDTPHLFEPWNVPEMELSMAGIKLGMNYPKPIVDHVEARNRALEAYKTIQS